VQFVVFAESFSDEAFYVKTHALECKFNSVISANLKKNIPGKFYLTFLLFVTLFRGMPNFRRFKSSHATAVYHCISRTTNGEHLFNAAEKEMLRKHLHQTAEFCGAEIITYAIMANHFHVLVYFPRKNTPDDAELLRRYKVLHPQPTPYATARIEVLKTLLEANGPDARKMREKLLARMGDLSEFMKTLKQRFSIWFNHTHNRFGTLWAERFSSTIVEGHGHFALKTMAAYIDLNPVRAGLVKDPKDYRWCGYGEAIAFGGPILKGLRLMMENEKPLDDESVLSGYRMLLFGKGTAPKAHGAPGATLSPESFAEVTKTDGKLPLSQRLRLRVNWLTCGAVIGSQQFVIDHLVDYRKRTRSRHHLKPCPFSRDGTTDWLSLFAMRASR
jgi:REP element-mobilizing transposase RayT